ncbi:MAG: Asp-tRNA(Asn)/Glu-tRNA(Gln) amidotransferase subunit GatB [Planctomycetales bacterium]|nr:Asp-tRNA(Asn)/Glu-tRNA(Gln) amidotransferase subunit GatB [Planctomycetales bacterium]
MVDYELIVGLEVHVQLNTQTKLFCGCSTLFGQDPNTATCPVCLGHPGALPVLNEEAIRLAVVTGLALNGSIPPVTRWDRKNYFYPDLPKGYQISQLDHPVVGGGYLDLPAAEGQEPRRIRLTRAHLEEDAGKSLHDETSGTGDSRIDLNRAGTPLLEIVSEPDLRSAAEAKQYLSELKLLLEHLQVSDCNMEQGSLRVDANVNLHVMVDGERVATPIVEIKNLNSFRAVERALEYESQRQLAAFLADGKRIGQVPKQTRGWDDAAQITRVQREKEESADYRYFPDPDLVPIQLAADWVESLRARMSHRPAEIRQRLAGDLGLSDYDAGVLVAMGPACIAYFEQAIAAGGDAKRVSNWLQQDITRSASELGVTLDQFPVPPAVLGELVARIGAGEFTTAQGKDLFQHLLSQGGSVGEAAEAIGIEAVDESALDELCQQLIAAHPQVVDDIRGGKAQAVGAMIGAARKIDRNADPGKVRARLLELIQST